MEFNIDAFLLEEIWNDHCSCVTSKTYIDDETLATLIQKHEDGKAHRQNLIAGY